MVDHKIRTRKSRNNNYCINYPVPVQQWIAECKPSTEKLFALLHYGRPRSAGHLFEGCQLLRIASLNW